MNRDSSLSLTHTHTHTHKLILQSFNHPHIVSNLYTFNLLWNTKGDGLAEGQFLHTMKVKGDRSGFSTEERLSFAVLATYTGK